MAKKQFYLRAGILSVYSNGLTKGHVYVPAGAVILVTSSGQPLVDIEWQDRKLKMFAEDISNRGQLVGDQANQSFALA